jgi:O-antigen ligase
MAILLSIYYMLKTASRGAFVAGVILLVVTFIVTKSKMKLALVLIPVGLIVPLVNRAALERLVMIYVNPDANKVDSDVEGGAVMSQVSRQHLLRMSLELTAKHPLFGVGPGQFIEATSGAEQRHGRHSPALGTHNTYTQISSECGVIAFICFAGPLFISLKKVLVLYKKTRDHPEAREIANMAYVIVLALTGFCAVALFHHVGYTGYAAQLTGLAIALSLAAQESLAKLQPVPRWAPAVSAPSPRQTAAAAP